jgi:hypothetical protein
VHDGSAGRRAHVVAGQTTRHDELAEGFNEGMIAAEIKMLLGRRRTEADVEERVLGKMRAK